MNQTKIVKLKEDTIQILQGLKITKRESYDEVINRLFIQTLAEDQLELNEALKNKLMERFKTINEGRVRSFDQVLEAFKRKKEMAEVRMGENMQEETKKKGDAKKNPWRNKKNATLGS